MNNPNIITTDQLAEISGYKATSHSAIEQWCEKNGIRYFPGRNGPTSTIHLLNAAQGLVTSLPEDGKEDIF